MDEHATARTRRRRDRVFPWLTLIVAAVWVVGTYAVADHVKSVNFVRIFGTFMTAGMDDGGMTVQRPPANPFVPLPPGYEPPEPQTSHLTREEAEQQIGVTEVIVLVWEWSMYGVAGLVALAGLVSLLTRWTRGLHLLAGTVMLLSGVGTLVGMRLLVHPDLGGLPPLAIETHVLMITAQSMYGIVLWVAFARRRNTLMQGTRTNAGGD